ncbi:hypothetical protein METBIDRAFT_77381 [Metschnikowia bicuspidata var. bicuspidata NRRL YB-4993]|uniref:Bromodomain associated domain-containing protein n=1 Tax=Metschnikowia bicuspidata var. bicuspidata NRRL YB-4993 TaxID=869754 RepID=A0A1A0HCV8_9ASCO|nr:hypothetical protein METBIDRAFT_77381 [Metschnikowia bicuspidata var. bicuspidata NRRL YB-4993]OBA21815.1 hypothetical protein METBIDRAFT_77381 [Metschnikowia bicuspidata var. bicuspidata NRRL YB-4993]
MEETFFFALLRISVAQILKAAGFDKCKPLVLNIITELYIKHLELVIEKTKKFSLARTNAVNDVVASDVAEALLNIGFIKPTLANDPQDKKNTKSLKSFKNWVQYSDSFSVSKKLSSVPSLHLANLIEKRKIDTSSETDQERKKRRLRERQEYFNQLKQGDDSTRPDKESEFPDDLDEDELTTSDRLSWLAYLAEKDMKLGQNMKFVNTCIQDDLINVHKLKKFHPTPLDGEDSYVLFKSQIRNSNKNDHFLLQLQEDEKTDGTTTQPHILPPPHLKSALPYNLKYHECLMDDDLQQYLQYASTHEDEINRRLNIHQKQKQEPENVLGDDSISPGKESRSASMECDDGNTGNEDIQHTGSTQTAENAATALDVIKDSNETGEVEAAPADAPVKTESSEREDKENSQSPDGKNNETQPSRTVEDGAEKSEPVVSQERALRS